MPKAKLTDEERLARVRELLALPDKPEQDAEGYWTPYHGMPPAPEMISELRRRLGLTQSELGRRAGVAASFICRVEKGAESTLATYERLVAAMGGRLELRVRLPGPIDELAMSNPGVGRWEKEDRERERRRRAPKP